MKRLLPVAVSLFLAACASSQGIPEHLVEVGPGDPITIDLVSFDPAGLLMQSRNVPQFAKAKVRVSNSSRDDLHVVRVTLTQETFGNVNLRPSMAGFDVTIPSGGSHVFEMGMYGDAGEPVSKPFDAEVGLRIAVFTSSLDGYYTSAHFPLSAPPRER
jgi:hypothetical protein